MYRWVQDGYVSSKSIVQERFFMRSVNTHPKSKKLIVLATALVLAATAFSSLAASAATKKIDYTVCPRFTGTITFFGSMPTEPQEGIAYKEYLAEWAKTCPSTKVIVSGITNNDLNAKLAILAVSRNLPDVFEVAPAQAIAMSGSIADLNPILGADYIAGFAKSNVTNASIGKKLLFAPLMFIPPAVLYRTDLFKEAGVTVPKTWDEFKATCKKLTKDTNGDGKIDQYGFAMVGTDNGSGQGRFENIGRNFGYTSLTKVSGDWKTGIDANDGFKDTLQLYKDLASTCVAPGYTSNGYPEASLQVGKGAAAMMITGPHSIGLILGSEPSVKGKLGGFPIPAAAGVTAVSTLNQMGYAISKNSTHKTAAAAFIKFLLNKKNQLRFNELSYRLPTRLDALKDLEAADAAAGFIKAGNGALYFDPPAPFLGKITALNSKAYQAVMAGTLTPAQAVEKYAGEARKIIDDNK